MLTDATAADRIAMSTELIRELGEKNEEIPELIAVVAMPADDYARIASHRGLSRRGAGPAVQPRERRHRGALGRCVRGGRGDRDRARRQGT